MSVWFKYQVFLILLSINCILYSDCFQSNTLAIKYRSSDAFGLKMSNAMKHSFDPFASRNKNINIQWYHNDLDSFYQFVESQPLLTKEQEQQCGKAIQMWTKIQLLRNKYQIQLGPETHITDQYLAEKIGCSELTIEKMAKYSEIAKTRLVNSNLRLVLAIVSRYRTTSIANAELIAEGIKGLTKSVIRFDHSKGFRFATYSTWYVHQAVADYVKHRKHPAKMPTRYQRLLRTVKEFQNDYKLEHPGCYPNVKEIAAKLNVLEYDVVKVLTMQIYPALLTNNFRSRNIRLSTSYSKEGTLEDILPSANPNPNIQSKQTDSMRCVEVMLQKNLNTEEINVLKGRLGLDDGQMKPIKEVGKRFKISWRQAKNLENAAISKLLVCDEVKELKENYDSYVSV